jgi:oligosaccharide repeat unit polymerase
VGRLVKEKKTIDIFSPFIFFPFIYVSVNLFLSRETSLFTFFCVFTFFFTYYASVLFFYINKKNKTNLLFYVKNELHVKYQFSKFKSAAIVIVSIVFTSTLIYIYQLIPNKEEFRQTYSNYLLGGSKVTPIYNYFLMTFYCYLSLIFNKNKINKYLFFFSTLIIFTIVFLTGSRSSMALFALIPIFISYYNRTISNKSIIILVMIGLVVFISIRIYTIFNSPLLTYYVTNDIIVSNDPIQTVLNFIFSQFQDIGFRTNTIIMGIPNNYPRLYGKSLFFEFYSLLPGEQLNPAIDLNHKLFHSSEGEVQIPPTLIAELFLDFGYIGVLVGGGLVGYFYALFHFNFKIKPSFINYYSYLITSYFIYLSIYGRIQVFYIIFFLVMNNLFYRATIKINKIQA